jgi:hypothetical protein
MTPEAMHEVDIANREHFYVSDDKMKLADVVICVQQMGERWWSWIQWHNLTLWHTDYDRPSANEAFRAAYNYRMIIEHRVATGKA